MFHLRHFFLGGRVSFGLPPCVCFFLLARSPMTPSLGQVALIAAVLWDPGSQTSFCNIVVLSGWSWEEPITLAEVVVGPLCVAQVDNGTGG